MLTLFPDEQIVVQPNSYVTLTTHRIWNERSGLGKSSHQSMMLEHITSCESHHISYILLLVAGIGCAVGAAASASEEVEMAGGLGIGALFCLLLFFITRRTAIVISSPSMKMKVNASGMNRQKVHDFINTIEQTKQKRLDSLKAPGAV